MGRRRVAVGAALAVVAFLAGCPREQPESPPAEAAPEKVAPRPDAGRPREEAKAPARSDAEPSSAEREEGVDLLHAVPVEVAASSAYHDDAAQVARLFDGDLETAWNSRTGDLSGAWIEVALPSGAEVEAIEMTAGYTKRGSRDLFTGNHRVERVRVLRGTEVVGTFPLDVDSRELQRLPVSGPGGTYRIELASLRPGTEAGWREACVSELRVVGRAPGARPGASTPTTRVGARPGDAAADAGPAAADGGAPQAEEGDEETGDEGAGEATAAAPELFEADGIRLTELTLAPAVEDREPVDPRTTFSRSSDERIYCYLRLDNPGSRATTLHVTWERADGSSSRAAAPLNIPAMRQYRTWTWGGTRFPAGRYRAVVRTAEGSLLGQVAYELTE